MHFCVSCIILDENLCTKTEKALEKKYFFNSDSKITSCKVSDNKNVSCITNYITFLLASVVAYMRAHIVLSYVIEFAWLASAIYCRVGNIGGGKLW